MSAPENAYPICPKGIDDLGQSMKDVRVECKGCKWRGHVGELLGVDDEETMWCPQCRTIAWEYT